MSDTKKRPLAELLKDYHDCCMSWADHIAFEHGGRISFDPDFKAKSDAIMAEYAERKDEILEWIRRTPANFRRVMEEIHREEKQP